MLKRVINIFIAASLVILMMLSGVAHEFVHSFTGHEDTVHHIQNGKHGGMSFEKEHHHCDFLQFPSPVFLTSSFYVQFHPSLEHIEKFQLIEQAVFSRLGLYTALRGPPFLA